jgi:hypothetical protein
MAASHWVKRVIIHDPRVVMMWVIIDCDQRLRIALEEAHHTDCQAGNPWLSILDPSSLICYK